VTEQSIQTIAVIVTAVATASLAVLTGLYVLHTRKMVDEMARQSKLAIEQATRASQPLVVIERVEVAGGWAYHARNVGVGPAFDVVYANDREIFGLHTEALGSLGSGRTSSLPTDVQNRLSSHGTASGLGHSVPPHLVFALPVTQDYWVVSGNLVQEGGEVLSRSVMVPLSEARQAGIQRAGTRSYLTKHWSNLRDEIGPMWLADLDRAGGDT
jgi:hypothetical protein